MVETIAPVVHGERRSEYWLSVTLHVLGAGASAAVMGGILGAVGGLAGAPWGTEALVALAVVAAVYALRELGVLPAPIPCLRRQVPEWWRTFFRPPTAAFLYGLGLGVGFFTYLPSGALVAVAVAALASGNALAGAALCAPFGVARALSVTLARRAATGAETTAVADRLERVALTPIKRSANAAVLVTLMGVALVVAV
jgi:hypothetical protein